MTETAEQRIARVGAEIDKDWKTNPRWKGVVRDYTGEQVARLQGSLTQEHTLARMGAEKLWKALHENDYVHALGAITGNQAVEMAKAGLKAIYLSGWQVAGDGNSAAETYPDQSLYPYDSVPKMVKRINNALVRADQVDYSEGKSDVDYFLPIVADAEAGFGGPLNAYELAKHLIEAGASGMHYEDQLSSAKKCGHLGGKVLIPTQQHIQNLKAARLAADVEGVPTLLVARTDSLGANLITSDVDETDKPFLTGERSPEGHYYTTAGVDVVIARLLAFAPYADLLWVETNTPDPDVARKVAEAVKGKYPDKMLAYNCSPSFNWKANLSDDQIASFQKDLGAMGYAFQVITLAGFHQINYGMFDLAYGYAREGMSAYVKLQQAEFASESRGYTATKHQREVGAGYFDLVSTTVNPESSTLALKGSTEEAQF
ncbi:isocitrate lyase [Mobiluncus sp.]|uniref:isocitrate lyase n=1 Tax=Mobiluncus sp. TaxID=47293 RepID=UPI002A911A76|nr:isocitrate lyase [Mobiluncus sp.]MDY6077649.1 isocitrate lyase [Mobiluncus sp.]